MTKLAASAYAPAAERAASLMERTAQLEAVLHNPDAGERERQQAATSLGSVATAVQDEQIPPAHDPADIPNLDGPEQAAHADARRALANLHRRVADWLDPPER